MFDSFCRDLEAGFGLVLSPLRPLLRRVDGYLNRRDASPLGQTLVTCFPVLLFFVAVLLAIDLR
jgi:hypothetical protein